MLLSSTGTLCYISSNKFFRSGYGKALRLLLTARYSLRRLIDFGELPVFEAGTDPVITQFGTSAQPSFTATPKQQAAIASLVDRILAAKKVDPVADTSALEAEIDRLVYRLYELTPEEIAIVEQTVNRRRTPADSAEAKPAAEPKAKKPAARKRKTALPPSLPGWD